MSKRNSATTVRARRAKLEEITKGFRGIFIFLFSMSGIINVLALTGSLYMLQVYDRALTGGSIPTLLALSASGDRPLFLSGHVRRDPLAGAGAHGRSS